MKKLLLFFMFICLTVSAQTTLEYDINKTASLSKDKNVYILTFIDYGNKKQSFEFDLKDFDKVYSLVAKADTLGIKSENSMTSLPITYSGDDSGMFFVSYPVGGPFKPIYTYMYGPERMKHTLTFPAFTKANWDLLFGK